MDRVRLGRVLGKGARLAARTAMEAVEAASSPSPEPTQARPPVQAHPPVGSQPRTITIETPVRAERPRTVEQQQPAAGRPRKAAGIPFASTPLRPAFKAARAGIVAPLRRASRALWHELTGSFFALFAFSFWVGLWHSRMNAFSSLATDRHRFYAFCAMALLFSYFAVSSFMRAKRESR